MKNDGSSRNLSRRQLLARATPAAAICVLGKSSLALNSMSVDLEKKSKHNEINRASVAGERYEAIVPDTLDLAERAKLGLNQLTEQISEADDYEMYSRQFFDYQPPRLRFYVDDLGCCQPKALEAMAMLRLMSGSEQNLEREAKMIGMMVSHLGEDDGLYWVLPSPDKPWLGPEEYKPYVYVHGQARMMRAMLAWYQYTGEPAWKRRIDKMVEGMNQIVEHKGDYAYFPIRGWMDGEYFRSCYSKNRGWKDRSEPATEKAGEEGSLFNHQGHTPGVLANWYLLSGNTRAIQLAGKLVRFLTKPKFWELPGTNDPLVFGYSAENAHWSGHFHGHINTLRAILEYAISTNDAGLKAFVRSGYEWARSRGIARLGLFDDQGCGAARMLGLAIKLTDAAVGDYWEDVDQYIRNNGSELQLSEIQEIRRLCEGPRNFSPEGFTETVAKAYGVPRLSPFEITPRLENSDRVPERSVGGFGRLKLPFGGPPLLKSIICCNSQGNMGLFYAWDATLRYRDGVAEINLLLNRASPWLDIDSYLPYEGKVVIKNKVAREAWVRIPLWVDKKEVRCWAGPKEIRLPWYGNSIRAGELKPGDVLTISFPMTQTREQYTLASPYPEKGPTNRTYTLKFKGNTLLESDPPLAPEGYPFYRRDYLKANQTLRKTVVRYVSPLALKW